MYDMQEILGVRQNRKERPQDVLVIYWSHDPRHLENEYAPPPPPSSSARSLLFPFPRALRSTFCPCATCTRPGLCSMLSVPSAQTFRTIQVVKPQLSHTLSSILPDGRRFLFFWGGGGLLLILLMLVVVVVLVLALLLLCCAVVVCCCNVVCSCGVGEATETVASSPPPLAWSVAQRSCFVQVNT